MKKKKNDKQVIKIPKIGTTFGNLSNNSFQKIYCIDDTYIFVYTSVILITKDLINYTIIYQSSIDTFIHRNIFHSVFLFKLIGIYKIYTNSNIHTELIDVLISGSSDDKYKVIDDTLFFQIEPDLNAVMYSNGEYESINGLKDQITNWREIEKITIFKSSSGRIYFVGIDNTNFVLYIYEFNQETSSFELCVNKTMDDRIDKIMYLNIDNYLYIYYSYRNNSAQYGIMYELDKAGNGFIYENFIPRGIDKYCGNSISVSLHKFEIFTTQFGNYIFIGRNFTKVTEINNNQLSTSIYINKSQDRLLIYDEDNYKLHELIGDNQFITKDVTFPSSSFVYKDVQSKQKNNLVKSDDYCYIATNDDTQTFNQLFVTKYELNTGNINSYSLINEGIKSNTKQLYKINDLLYLYSGYRYIYFYDNQFNLLSIIKDLSLSDYQLQFIDNKYLGIYNNKLIEIDPYAGTTLNTYQITDTSYSYPKFVYYNDCYYTIGKNGTMLDIYKSQNKDLNNFTLIQSIDTSSTSSYRKPLAFFVFKNKLYLYIGINSNIRALLYIYNTDTELFEKNQHINRFSIYVNDTHVTETYIFINDRSVSELYYSKDGIHFYRGNLPNNYASNIYPL